MEREGEKRNRKKRERVKLSVLISARIEGGDTSVLASKPKYLTITVFPAVLSRILRRCATRDKGITS